MRLLLFSDIHCDADSARRLVEMSVDADVVIAAGDLATMRRGLTEVITILSAIDRPTVLVPGNSESFEELVEACQSWSSATVLHGSGITIDGIPIWGVGGAIPVTPFGSWSYDFSEDQAFELLNDCPQNAVLVSHSPPQGAVDISSSGMRLGSTAVRNAVVDRQPLLVVCGHIHDSAGQTELIRGTPIVNAGPAGIMWTLDPNPDSRSDI